MDRRSRFKTLTILPTIDEVENQQKRQIPWLGILVISMVSIVTCSRAIHHIFVPHARQLRSIPKHTILFDDGTLFATQELESTCDYLTHHRRNHTAIKKLHFHFYSCQDSPWQFQDYFRAYLLADATKINYSSSCGDEAVENSLISRLGGDNLNSRVPPRDLEEKKLTPTDLCNFTLHQPFLTRDTIQNSFQGVVPKFAVAKDVVLQVDSSIPISTYLDLVKKVILERGTVETVLIVGKLAQSSAIHLSSAFPDLEIEVQEKEKSILQLHSQMMYAKVAGICSTMSLCGLAILSNKVGGFLSIDEKPGWIFRNTAWEASNIEFFGVASQQIALM